MNRDTELQRVVDFFESLTEESVQQLGNIYSADAFFKDPFNEVYGLKAIQDIFSHMYQQVDQPRFVVTTHLGKDNEAFLTWDFLFHMKRFSTAQQTIRGASHLRFDEAGRVNYHRDYWDVAEELYEKLPVLGSLMRLLKRAGKK